MFAIAVLVPGLLLGAIAWGVVGALRQRGREEFTQATAAALYAQVMVVAGVLATLAGAGLLVKLLLSLIDPSYSYFVPRGETAGSFAPVNVHDQQAQDLIMAAMLAGIGLLVAGGHALLARFVARLRGGSPAWIVRGTLIVLIVLTGLAGFLSLIYAGYSTLVYFLVNSQNSAFGDPAASAVVFVPAWIVLMAMFLRQLRRAAVPPPSVMAVTQ